MSARERLIAALEVSPEVRPGQAAALVEAFAAEVYATAPQPCCHLHKPSGCCDPQDCGPCCEDCPTCPTLANHTPGDGSAS